MNLVRNERTKYLATLLNTVAAASIAAGVIAPLVAFSYGVPGPISGTVTVVISMSWLLIGALLHATVYRVLGRLVP